MNLSEFLNIMFKAIGGGMTNAEYVRWIFSLIIKDTCSHEEDELDNAGLINPVDDYSQDMVRKIFSGTKKLSSQKAMIILRNFEGSKFIDQIYELDLNIKEILVDELDKYGFKSNTDDIDTVCLDIFVGILNAISDEKEEFYPNSLKKRNAKGRILNEIPITKVYVDNGKIYVGGDFIELPDALNYDDGIPLEEQPYIKAICEAFSDALNKQVCLETIDTLPKKYREAFKDHRNYYNNAAWLEHSLRDTFDGFDNQLIYLKEDVYEGIKETYYKENYQNGNERLEAVMIKITNTTLDKSYLTKIVNLIGNKEKKGLCHILVNDGTIVSWVDINAE